MRPAEFHQLGDQVEITETVQHRKTAHCLKCDRSIPRHEKHWRIRAMIDRERIVIFWCDDCLKGDQ